MGKTLIIRRESEDHDHSFSNFLIPYDEVTDDELHKLIYPDGDDGLIEMIHYRDLVSVVTTDTARILIKARRPDGGISNEIEATDLKFITDIYKWARENGVKITQMEQNEEIEDELPKLYNVVDSDDKEEFFQGNEETVKQWLWDRYRRNHDGEFIITPVDGEEEADEDLKATTMPEWWLRLTAAAVQNIAVYLGTDWGFKLRPNVIPNNELHQTVWNWLYANAPKIVPKELSTIRVEDYVMGHLGNNEYTNESDKKAEIEIARRAAYTYLLEELVEDWLHE